MDFTELLERLKILDEITLLEALEISSEDIVDRFVDKIELKEINLYEFFEIEDTIDNPEEGMLEWWETDARENYFDE